VIGVLQDILCWVKQIGAMVLAALVDAFNTLLAGLIGLVNAFIEAWPIGMPALPDAPSQLATAFAWLAWSPIPMAAILAYALFALTVLTAWWIGAPILRWVRAID